MPPALHFQIGKRMFPILVAALLASTAHALPGLDRFHMPASPASVPAPLRYRDPCESHLVALHQLTGDLRLPRPLRLGEAARFDGCTAAAPTYDAEGWNQRAYWASRLATRLPRDTPYQQLLEGIWYGYAEDVAAFFQHGHALPAPRLVSSFSVPGVDEGSAPAAAVIFDFGIVALALDRLLDEHSAAVRGVHLPQHRKLGIDQQHLHTLTVLAEHREALTPEQCLASEFGAMLLVDLFNSPVRRQGYIQVCTTAPVARAWQSLIARRDSHGAAAMARQTCRSEFAHLPDLPSVHQATDDPVPPLPAGTSGLPVRRWFEASTVSRQDIPNGDQESDVRADAACSGLDDLPFASDDFLRELSEALTPSDAGRH